MAFTLLLWVLFVGLTVAYAGGRTECPAIVYDRYNGYSKYCISEVLDGGRERRKEGKGERKESREGGREGNEEPRGEGEG